MIARSWSELPKDRPIHIVGTGFEELECALDPLPNDAPYVFGYRTAVRARFDHLVDDVVGLLEHTAVDMFPAWLPDASDLTDVSAPSLRAADELARREASASGYSAPLLCALTRSALGARPPTGAFPREIRAEQLSRVVRRTSGRNGIALLLDVEGPGSAGRDMELAADWLSRHARMGVWITGSSIERFSPWRLELPQRASIPTPPPPVGPSLPKSGSPRADSDVECALESALSREVWALDREWNKTLRMGTLLTSPIRVDLVWQDQALVIEIDGAEHRAVGKYAADRRRDNMLQLRGYMTLRYTNEQILQDISAVVDQVRSAVERPRDRRTVRNVIQ